MSGRIFYWGLVLALYTFAIVMAVADNKNAALFGIVTSVAALLFGLYQFVDKGANQTDK